MKHATNAVRLDGGLNMGHSGPSGKYVGVHTVNTTTGDHIHTLYTDIYHYTHECITYATL